MTEISYQNDVTLNEQRAQGSDGRLNVSSRTDGRAYYNSRDLSNAYSLAWKDASTATGDIVAYWKNTHSTKTLVIDAIGFNSSSTSTWSLHLGSDDTAGGGVATVPLCLNRVKPIDADATALTADSSTITGVTAGSLIDTGYCQAYGHGEFRLLERLRIEKNGNIIVKNDSHSSTGVTAGVIFAYYE